MKTSEKLLLLALCTLSVCASTASDTPDSPGVIHAQPEALTVNTPYMRILEISEYLTRPENKVKAQLPGPETQYGWQHMSKFGPTAQVLRSGRVSELEVNIDPAIGTVQFTNKKGETETVDSHFNQFPLDAMLVVKNGQIIYERYKTMRPTDKHIWFSVSKVTGSTLLALLEQEGKIDVKQRVTKYLPELAGTVWDTVKVEEALDMATGLNGTEHDEPTQDSRTNPEQIWYQWGASLGILADVKQGQHTWVDVLRKMQRVKPGHEAYEYNSINTFVVNRIVERVSGKPLNELFSERIWSKAGMGNDAYYLVSPGGLPLGFMGVNSTLGDLARFGLLFTPSWNKVSQEQLVPDAVLETIRDTTHAGMFNKGWAGTKFSASFPDAKAITNRYQWDAIIDDGDMYKSGVGGQGLYISPSRDTVVAWFCTGSGSDQEETMARAIAKALNK